MAALTVSERDREDAIRTIIGEAAGEGETGMLGVAFVIRNRSISRGQSIGDVVRAPRQFAGYYAPGAGALADMNDPAIRRQAERALDMALSGEVADPTDGADHFHSRRASPSWSRVYPRTAQIEGHTFYKSPAMTRAAESIAVTSAPPPARVVRASTGSVATGNTFNMIDRSGELGGDFDIAGSFQPNALVIHHTGGRGTVDGVVQTFRDRGYPAHFIIDRDGNVTQVLALDQRGSHLRPSETGQGSSFGDVTNTTAWGVEVMANDDADVTEAQIQAAVGLARFLNENYDMPLERTVPHGMVNFHKQGTEGSTIYSAMINLGLIPTVNPVSRDRMLIARGDFDAIDAIEALDPTDPRNPPDSTLALRAPSAVPVQQLPSLQLAEEGARIENTLRRSGASIHTAMMGLDDLFNGRVPRTGTRISSDLSMPQSAEERVAGNLGNKAEAETRRALRLPVFTADLLAGAPTVSGQFVRQRTNMQLAEQRVLTAKRKAAISRSDAAIMSGITHNPKSEAATVRDLTMPITPSRRVTSDMYAGPSSSAAPGFNPVVSSSLYAPPSSSAAPGFSSAPPSLPSQFSAPPLSALTGISRRNESMAEELMGDLPPREVPPTPAAPIVRNSPSAPSVPRQPVQPRTPTVQLYQAGGYIYKSNGAGGYTRIGAVGDDLQQLARIANGTATTTATQAPSGGGLLGGIFGGVTPRRTTRLSDIKLSNGRSALSVYGASTRYKKVGSGRRNN